MEEKEKEKEKEKLKKKMEDEFGIGVKVESDGMTRNEKIVAWLYVGAVISAILTIYRIYVLSLVISMAPVAVQCTHLSSILVFASMTAWLGFYGKYRTVSKTYNDIQLTNEYTIMKVLSYLASLFCLLRVLSTLAYFLQLQYTNVITVLYVIIEMGLWCVLSAYFFQFGKERSRRTKKLKKDDFNKRLKL